LCKTTNNIHKTSDVFVDFILYFACANVNTSDVFILFSFFVLKKDGLAIVIRLVFVLFAQLFILLIHILTLFAKMV